MIKRKKFIVTLLAIVVFAYGINYAEAIGSNCWMTGTTKPDVGGGDGGGNDECAERIHCSIQEISSQENLIVKENIYDNNDTLLGSALVLQNQVQVVSGRFVGIDAYEEYSKTFYVSINPYCREANLHESTYTEFFDCPGQETAHGCSIDIPITIRTCDACELTADDWKYCHQKAEEHLAKMFTTYLEKSKEKEPHFIAKRQNVNDIEKGITQNPNNNKKEPTIEPTITIGPSQTHIGYSSVEPADIYSTIMHQTATVTHTYNLSTAWIDTQSGKVKYEPNITDLNNGELYTKVDTRDQSKDNYPLEKDDKETYMQVPNTTITRSDGYKVNIGKYFIPLNATSEDIMRYYLYPNLSRPVLSKEMCEALIRNHNDSSDGKEHWKAFLTTTDGTPFRDIKEIKTADDAKTYISNGCRMGIFTEFKIVQGFYNEVGNGLKGYDFYYRPIDHTNPFPNGLAKDSIWRGLYDSNNNTVNTIKPGNKEVKVKLNDSYSTVTYATDNSYNVNTVRVYNKNRIYSSWQGMKKNGRSDYISGNNGISRYNTGDIYNLGCGPQNATWDYCKSQIGGNN